jgi:hypothetical protein
MASFKLNPANTLLQEFAVYGLTLVTSYNKWILQDSLHCTIFSTESFSELITYLTVLRSGIHRPVLFIADQYGDLWAIWISDQNGMGIGDYIYSFADVTYDGQAKHQATVLANELNKRHLYVKQ